MSQWALDHRRNRGEDTMSAMLPERVLFPAMLPSRGFSFAYDGRPADAFLDSWRREERVEPIDAARTRVVTEWTDPATGLRARRDLVRYADFPAAEWLLSFENTGAADTAIA